MKYFKYLKYVIKHKWFVFQECIKFSKTLRIKNKPKIIWRGIIHDLSKFLPDEFIPYADFFYGDGNTKGTYKKRSANVEKKFHTAWLKHIHRNPHHWQYWILINDNDEPKINMLDMDAFSLFEMVCDWRGAGRAINGFDDTTNWYLKNKENIMISAKVREFIEKILE